MASSRLQKLDVTRAHRRISPKLARRQLKERPSRVSCRATRRAEPLAEKALFSGADGGRSASERQKCRGVSVSPP